jgi:lambda family phage minor tail protein L
MDKNQAKISIKNLSAESSKLETTALITLFEIDMTVPLENSNIYVNENERIFYFHNNTKLISTNIVYQGNTYILCPIQAEGFDITSQGVLPTPSLRITVSEAGLPILSILKEKIALLGDLVGANVIRRRTFSRFLSASNFDASNMPSSLSVDEYAEFPRDSWFVNRKSNENKLMIEYELNSVLDFENLQLPKRQMIAKRCNFNYRGEGCLYENNLRRNDNIHGEFAILPESAPAVATEDDKLITEILGITQITQLGAFQQGNSYQIGQSVYIERGGIKYYFVARMNGVTLPPPDPNYWISDKCSKSPRGCKLRWGASNPEGAVIIGLVASAAGLKKGELPFGGFPGVDRIRG